MLISVSISSYRLIIGLDQLIGIGWSARIGLSARFGWHRLVLAHRLIGSSAHRLASAHLLISARIGSSARRLISARIGSYRLIGSSARRLTLALDTCAPGRTRRGLGVLGGPLWNSFDILLRVRVSLICLRLHQKVWKFDQQLKLNYGKLSSRF